MKIYRRRYLPEELLWLKDDEIIFSDDEKIITSWASLKPRPDFSHGRSCYFLHKNYKISKFFDHGGNLLFHYCDIVKLEVSADEYVFCDLLVDVKVYPDGFVEILDLDELAFAYEKRLISEADMACALKTLDGLLKVIYSGKFDDIAKNLNDEQ